MNINSSMQLLLWLYFVLWVAESKAQTVDSLPATNQPSPSFHPIQYFLQQDVMLHAAYPFLMEKNQPEFYRASLAWQQGNGGLHQALEEESFKNMQFESQSRKNLGNWTFQGDFRYTRALHTQRSFLLQSLGNPLNPFLIGQKESGPWAGDEVVIRLSGNSARYLQGKAGNYFRVSYSVETSAMDAEPRPLFNKNEYSLQLGQNFRPSKQLELGIAGNLSRTNEENQIGAFTAQEFSLIFMRGLNTFSRTSFQSFTRNQFIENFTFQTYAKYSPSSHSTVMLLLESGIESISIRDGIAFPVSGGSVRGITHALRSVWNTAFDKGMYQQHLSVKFSNGTAIDPIFQAVNFTSQYALVEGNHTFAHTGVASVWDLTWSKTHLQAEDLAAGSIRNLSSWYIAAANSFEWINRPNFSGFLRPKVGLFLPQAQHIPSILHAVDRYLHEPTRLFYESTHWEGGLSTYVLFPTKKEAINMGVDFTNRRQKTSNYSTIQLNLSIIL